MDTAKITRDRLNIFVVAGKHYSSVNPRTKVVIAIEKILPKAIRLLKGVELERDLLRIDYVEKIKSIPQYHEDGKNYKMTDENQKKYREKILEWDEEEDAIEIPIHIIPAGQYDEKSLSYDLRRAFEGIVIPAQTFEDEDFENAPIKVEESDHR